MEDQHKKKIQSNLGFLVKDVDYERLRIEVLKQKLFPLRQLELFEERSNPKLELFLGVQKRGPSAFRKLVASLAFSGHDQAVEVLLKDEQSFLLNNNNSHNKFLAVQTLWKFLVVDEEEAFPFASPGVY